MGYRNCAATLLALSAVGLTHGLGTTCTFTNSSGKLVPWGVASNWDCAGKQRLPTTGDKVVLSVANKIPVSVDLQGGSISVVSLSIENNATLYVADPVCGMGNPSPKFTTSSLNINGGILDIRSCYKFEFSTGTVTGTALLPGVIRIYAEDTSPAYFGGSAGARAPKLSFTSNTKFIMGKTGSHIQNIQAITVKASSVNEPTVDFTGGYVLNVTSFQIQGMMAGTQVGYTTFHLTGYLTIQSNQNQGVTFDYTTLQGLATPSAKLTLYTDHDEPALTLGGASSGVSVAWINAQLYKKKGTTLVANNCGTTTDTCTQNGPFVQATTMKVSGSPYKVTGGTANNGVFIHAVMKVGTLTTAYTANATHAIPTISFPACSSITGSISSNPGCDLTVELVDASWCSQVVGTLAGSLRGPVSLTVGGSFRINGNIKSTGTLIAHGLNMPTLLLGGTAHSFDHIYVMNATVNLLRTVTSFAVNELWMGAPGTNPFGEVTQPTITGDPSLVFDQYTVNKFGFGFPNHGKAGKSADIVATMGIRLKTKSIVVSPKVFGSLTIALANPTGGGPVPEIIFDTVSISSNARLILGIDGRTPISPTAPRHIRCTGSLMGLTGAGLSGSFGLENVTLTADHGDYLAMARQTSMFMGPGAVLGNSTVPLGLNLLGDNYLHFNQPSAEISKMKVSIRGGAAYTFKYRGDDVLTLGALEAYPHQMRGQPARVVLGTYGESWTINDLTSNGIGEFVIENNPPSQAAPNKLTIGNINAKSGKSETDQIFFRGKFAHLDQRTFLNLPATLYGNIIVNKNYVTFASSTVKLDSSKAGAVSRLWFEDSVVPAPTADMAAGQYSFSLLDLNASVALDFLSLQSNTTSTSYVISPLSGGTVYLWGRNTQEAVNCSNSILEKPGPYTVNVAMASLKGNGFFAAGTKGNVAPHCSGSTPQAKQVAPIPAAPPSYPVPWPTAGPPQPFLPPQPFVSPMHNPAAPPTGPEPGAVPAPVTPPFPVAPVPPTPHAPVPFTPGTTGTPKAPKADADSGGIGSGGVAGIIIGVLAFLAIGAGAAYYLIVYRKRSMYKDIE